ncbi:hypothetical protein H0H92_003643, partial [Tricholoma furcatifolium]
IPVVEEGGQILDKRRSDITTELLWMNADRASRQAQFIQKKKMERLAKKNKEKHRRNAYVNKMGEEMNLHAIITATQGSSSSSTDFDIQSLTGIDFGANTEANQNQFPGAADPIIPTQPSTTAEEMIDIA